MNVSVYLLAFGGGEIREVVVPEEDVKVVAGGDKSKLLELVFYWGQNDFRSLNQPSVSVGDVVALNGEYWQVRGAGWKQMSEEEFKGLLERARNGDTRIGMEAMGVGG